MSGGASQHPYARFGRIPSSSGSSSSRPSPFDNPNSWRLDDKAQDADAAPRRLPSFEASSASSLPGALGLGSHQSSSSAVSATIPFALPTESVSGAHNHTRAANASLGKSSSAGPAYYSLKSGNHASLHASHQTSPTPPVERRGSASSLQGTTSSVASPSTSIHSGAPPTTLSAGAQRDFLVPIGSTGVRQKLSILSPSQRRTLAASSSAPQTLSENLRYTYDNASPSKSPYTQSYTSQPLSSPSASSTKSMVADRLGSDSRPSGRNGASHTYQLSSQTPPRPARSDQRQLSASPRTSGTALPSSGSTSPVSSMHQAHLVSPEARTGKNRSIAQNDSVATTDPSSIKTFERSRSGLSRPRRSDHHDEQKNSSNSNRMTRTRRLGSAEIDAEDGIRSADNTSPTSFRAGAFSPQGGYSFTDNGNDIGDSRQDHHPRNGYSFDEGSPRGAPQPGRRSLTLERPSTASSTASSDQIVHQPSSHGTVMYQRGTPGMLDHRAGSSKAVASGDSRRPSTSSNSSVLSDSRGARKDGLRGKFNKLWGSSSNARKNPYQGDVFTASTLANSESNSTTPWSPSRSESEGSIRDHQKSFEQTPSTSSSSLARPSPGPAILPKSDSANGSINASRKGSQPTAVSRTVSATLPAPRSSSLSSNLASRGSQDVNRSHESNHASLHEREIPSASSMTHAELPQLDPSISDFGDFSSFESSQAATQRMHGINKDHLGQIISSSDKTLPPTPVSASPRESVRKADDGKSPSGGLLVVPAVLPQVEDALQRRQRPGSVETQSSASSRRAPPAGPRPAPVDHISARRPSGTSVASIESGGADLALTSPAALNEGIDNGSTQSQASSADTKRGQLDLTKQSRQSINETRATAVNPSDAASSAQVPDPATYVPPGALSFNRKGTAVKDRASRAVPNGRLLSPSHSKSSSALIQSRFSADDDTAEESADDVLIEDRGSMLPSNAWSEVEEALVQFSGLSSSASSQAAVDKASLIRSILLPFLALEAETPNLEVAEGKYRSGKARRTLFFDWIAQLLLELQRVQTSADRGAILESIACIIESRNLSVTSLASDQADESKFSSTFGHILLYAVGELNKKGVYQNTLIFSGRLLAVAFFRVDGVANKLLRALPINRFALERVAAEMGWEAMAPVPFEHYMGCFPPMLQEHCFSDSRTYLRVLDDQTETLDGDNGYLVRQGEVEVQMTGNWLRRWQSDDSELFFSFCRSYHRQLGALFTSTRSLRRASKLFFGAPGYAHLATCIHLKCLSLVNRDILSVTTLSSQKSFNPGETANVLSGSTAGKPRHLEAANRRCTAIIVDIVRAPNANDQLFLPMLGVHIKCLIRRTSLYDVQGVFCLLDWLDGVLGHMDAADLSIERCVDIDFLITTLGLLMEKADHALALMRAIAFSYSNFAVLISTKEHRRAFCEEILLKPSIFNKLFLSWSFTIRAYFLHLLVFRLARISDFPPPEGDAKGQSAIDIARLFNQRLDDIRKRHQELSPETPGASNTDEDVDKDDNDDGRSTYSRKATSFVSTIKHTPSIVNVEATNKMTKAERVLGIGVPDPMLTGQKASSGDAFEGGLKGRSRAAKWLRVLGGKTNKKDTTQQAFLHPSDHPTISNRPRFQQMPPVSELDFDSDDEDTGDDGEGGGDEADVGDDVSPADSRQAATSAVPAPTQGIDPSLHGDHISADTTFDLQSLHSMGAGMGRHHGAVSPRVSRALSKRTSILPGPAYELVEHEGSDGPSSSQSALATQQRTREAYPRALHIYATHGLREWEAVLAEHDEFFAAMADQAGPPAVPRLPVQWPAMWSDQ